MPNVIQFDPTAFVVVGKWSAEQDWHIIGLFDSAQKANAAVEEALTSSVPRVQAKVLGEFWVQ